MEKAAFNFSATYLTSTLFYDRGHAQTPVVMEWAITRHTCAEAKIGKTIPYACVSNNSYCSTNYAGYVCKCSDGYEGNPYIVGGCTGSSSSSLFCFFTSVSLLMQRQWTYFIFNQAAGSKKI
jgi:hypothetical protein